MAKSNDTNEKRGAARVAVVAAGRGQPLGFGLSETLDSLREARDCVNGVTRFSVTGCRCKTAVNCPMSVCSRGGVTELTPDGGIVQSHMVIQALGEALTQEPQFKPDVNSSWNNEPVACLTARIIFASLNRNSSLRRSPTWIANYPAQKPVIDAQEAFGIFCAMPGHCECLRLGHKRDRSRLRVCAIRSLSTRGWAGGYGRTLGACLRRL